MSKEFEKIVLEKLNSLETSYGELKEKFAGFEGKVIPKLNSLETSYGELKEKFAGFEGEVIPKLNSLEGVIPKLNSLETLYGELKQELREFKNEQHVINEQNEKRFKGIEHSLVIIEDAVTLKIPALFEMDAIRMEKQQKLEEEQNEEGKVLTNHSIRISILEEQSKKHEKQLEDLVS